MSKLNLHLYEQRKRWIKTNSFIEPSEESSPAPKKSPYRPPGARAMPGMGFGMGGGIGSELAGKLKSRNKAVESEDKTGDSEEKPSPPVPK